MRDGIDRWGTLAMPQKTPEQKARNAEYMRMWRLNNPEEAKERNRRFRIEHRERWLALSRKGGAKYRAKNPEKYRKLKRAEYRRNTATKKRYCAEHSAEAKLRIIKWVALNPERYKAHAANSKAKRKLRMKGAMCENSAACIEKIAELHKEISCYWCGASIGDKTREIDHVTPIAKGGLHIPDNLVAACSPCNRKKSAKLPEEWAQELKRRVA